MRITSFVTLFIFSASFPLSAQQQLSQSKAERLYRKGSELIVHGNFGAARKVFSAFLEEASSTDPRRPEAEYYRAFSALRLGHTDGEKLITDFVAANPSSPKSATAYYEAASFFYDEKNYNKASSYFEKVSFPALTRDQQVQAHFKWGYSYFNLKKLPEALEQFNFVKTQNNPFAPAASYYAGFIEYSDGRYTEALADFKRAEASEAYASVVPHLIANVYYRQKKYDELIRYAGEVKQREDLVNAAEISMLVADAYYFKGDYEKAAEAYETFFSAGNAGKAEGTMLFRAGYANYSLERMDKALDYLRQSAAGKDSIRYYASYYLGILYLKRGEKPLAMNAFDVARHVPHDKKLAEEAAFHFAKVAFDARMSDQAIAELEKFISVYPASTHLVEAKELLAQAYINGNNFQKAIEYIEALPSKSPQVQQVYQKAAFLKGADLFNKESYAEAVRLFEKSQEYPKDPKYVVRAAFWAGEAYSIGGKYEEASRQYRKVIDMSTAAGPELVRKARYGLGYAFYNLQQYEEAQYNFREFVTRGNQNIPNFTDGLIRLADCYYVRKEYEQALEYYTRARNNGSPDNDYVLLQTGVIHGIQRQYAQARARFTELIEHYPRSQYRDEALFQLGQFEIEQGNYPAAADAFSKLIREAPNSKFLPYAYMRRATSYYNLKQYSNTAADYQAVVQQFPNHPVAQDALLPLQDALSMAGRAGEFDVIMANYKKANPGNKGLESIEFETAKNLYFDQQYQKALDRLKEFVNTYPQSARLQEARYYIAESLYRLKDFEKALPVYRQLSKDSTFTLGNRVMARMAEIEFSQRSYREAITSFRRLERLATSKKEQYSAWSGLMESFFQLGEYDSSDTYARIILERGAVSASAVNKASLYLGKSAYARGDYETAKDEFLNTLNAAQDEYGAEAKYLLGHIFYLSGEYRQCYETLISLNKDFASYEHWVGKSYLLLADNFVVQGDAFNARATLQSLVDHFPLPEVRDAAAARLKALDEEEAKVQAETDSLENNR